MIALFAVFLVEKSSRHGLLVAKISGGALVLLGIAIAASPELLQTIS
jgi:hypothetical protein